MRRTKISEETSKYRPNLYRIRSQVENKTSQPLLEVLNADRQKLKSRPLLGLILNRKFRELGVDVETKRHRVACSFEDWENQGRVDA